ncbi:MAG: hypothetical protein Q9160_000591 [Pyrenula sp. 1 TL-2023]
MARLNMKKATTLSCAAASIAKVGLAENPSKGRAHESNRTLLGISPRGDNNLLKSSPIQPLLVGCSDEEQKQLNRAWKDAGRIAAAHYKWVIPTWWHQDGAYQEAADLYLGTDTRKDPGWIYDGPLRRRLHFLTP